MKKNFFKKSLKALLVCTLILGSAQAACAANMLINSGFENGINGWNIAGAGWQAQNAVVHSGNLAAENTIPSLASQGHYGTLSQTFATTPGTMFYATLYAKSNISPLSTANAGLQISFLNAAGDTIAYYQDSIGGNTNWRQLYVARQAPTGTVQVRYQAYVFAVEGDTLAQGAKVYFDDAVFDTSYIAPPTQPFGLLNPNFDNGLHDWWQTGPNWGLETAQPYSAPYSAKNTIGVIPGYDYLAELAQDEPITPGNNVYATLKVKTAINPLSSAQAGLIIDFLDANRNPIQGSQAQQTVGGNTNWETMYAVALAPSNAVYARFRAFVFANQNDSLALGGIAYFDEGVFSTTYIAPPNTSALINPGFENGLNGWTVLEPFLQTATPPYVTWSVDSSNAFAGTYSAKNTIDIVHLEAYPNPSFPEWDGNYFATVSQTISNAMPGTTYYALAYAKTDINPLSLAQGGIMIQFLGSSGNVLGEYKDTTGGLTNWAPLYLAATAPTGTTQVRFSNIVTAQRTDAQAHGGLVYFDANILSTDYIAPPGTSDLINPGFENGLNGWLIKEPYLVGGTPATWSLEAASPFAGNFSAKNTININDLSTEPPPGGGPLPDYYATVSQEFVTTPGVTFYATAYAKTTINPVSLAQAGILIEFLNSAGVVIASSLDTIGGSTNWSQLYLAVTSPTGVAKVRYSCIVTALRTDINAHGGLVYFDENVFGTNYIAPPGTSGLINPGFENGLNGWLVTEPYLVGGTPATWGLESSSAFIGNFSAKNTININDLSTEPPPGGEPLPDYYATVSQVFDTTPGMTFYATLYAKTTINPVSTAKAGLLLDFLDANGDVIKDANGNSIGAQDIIGGNTNWRLLYAVAVAPSNAVKVRYSCMMFAPRSDVDAHNGLAFFDQAVLGTSYIAPPPPQADLINPGFENGLHDWSVIEPDLAPPPGQTFPLTWTAQSNQLYGGVLAAKNKINMTLQTGSDYFAALVQNIYTSPASSFPVYATARVKTNFVQDTGAVAGLRLDFYDANGVFLDSHQDQLGGTNTSWRELIVSVGQAAPGTARIKYTLFVWAHKTDALANNCEAYFDDAQISFFYVNRLGYVNGQDIFPQELAEHPYYSGAAGLRMTIRYLLGTSPSQGSLYSTYHWSGPGNDMNTAEITTALNTEVGFPYNFTDWYQTTSQVDAIKNFVYWIDYLPPMGMYSPAFVPINGLLKWRLVRGIHTDIKPHPDDQPMPSFSVHGLWVNDPSVSGLGFNMYQTVTAFQAEYLPLNGKYRSVYEPPENLNMQTFMQEFRQARVSLEPPRPSVDLMREIGRAAIAPKIPLLSKSDSHLIDQGSTGSHLKAITFTFNKQYLRQALPKALEQDSSFMNLFDKPGNIRHLEVFSKDTNSTYVLLAMDSAIESKASATPVVGKLSYRANVQPQVALAPTNTKIIIEVSPQTGAVMQATWDKDGEPYLKINQEQAVQIAQNHMVQVQGRSFKGNTQFSVRNQPILVWSRNYNTSRFQPSWEIVFSNNQSVIVHQNGACVSVNPINVSTINNIEPAVR